MSKYKKGDKLTVKSSRKGTYHAIAEEDFDTIKDEWLPVILDQDIVYGNVNEYYRGCKMPCRNSLNKISLRKD